MRSAESLDHRPHQFVQPEPGDSNTWRTASARSRPRGVARSRRSSAASTSCFVLPFTANRNGKPNLARYVGIEPLKPLELRRRQAIEPGAALLADRRVAHAGACRRDRGAREAAPAARPRPRRSTTSVIAACRASTDANGARSTHARPPRASPRRSTRALARRPARSQRVQHPRGHPWMHSAHRSTRTSRTLSAPASVKMAASACSEAGRALEHAPERRCRGRTQIDEVRGLARAEVADLVRPAPAPRRRRASRGRAVVAGSSVTPSGGHALHQIRLQRFLQHAEPDAAADVGAERARARQRRSAAAAERCRCRARRCCAGQCAIEVSARGQPLELAVGGMNVVRQDRARPGERIALVDGQVVCAPRETRSRTAAISSGLSLMCVWTRRCRARATSVWHTSSIASEVDRAKRGVTA